MAAAIGVGDHVDVLAAMFEDATFENGKAWSRGCRDELPILARPKKRFHTKSRASVEIAGGRVSVAKCRRNRNNSLMLIVGESDKDVRDPNRSLCKREARRSQPQEQCQRLAARRERTHRKSHRPVPSPTQCTLISLDTDFSN